MRSIVLVFLFLTSIISCSTPDQIRDSRATLGRVQSASEVQRYLLAELPHWANFSSEASCHRQSSIKYINFENIKKSFNLTYTQSVNLQHMFNKKVYAYKSSIAGHDTVSNLTNLQDESFIFYNVYEQVMAGSFDFKVPQFKNISIVWIDDILDNKNKIKKIFNSSKVLRGFPVMLSQCLSHFELEKLAQELDIENLGVKFISAEMFNHYGRDFRPSTEFQLHLDLILPSKIINLFSSEKPRNIYGINEFIKF